MEIIKEYKKERCGNECLIKDYVCLIKLNNNLYVVIHTESVCGSWTGNPKNTKCATLEYYDDALRCMMIIVSKLELGIN